MSILAWVFLGLVSGFIASKMVNGSGEGLMMDMVLGVVRSVRRRRRVSSRRSGRRDGLQHLERLRLRHRLDPGARHLSRRPQSSGHNAVRLEPTDADEDMRRTTTSTSASDAVHVRVHVHVRVRVQQWPSREGTPSR